MKSGSSAIARIILLSAALVAMPVGSAHAQGSSDESRLRDLAGRASSYTGEVRELLARGVDPNVPDSGGRTAVHAAAAIGAAETLDVLLQAGGKPSAQDEDGNTPLHFAAEASSPRLAEDDSIAAIRILLGYQAEPDRANRNGETALHLAARSHDRPDGVAALLRAGADPNQTDRRGDTPLHAALGPHRGVPGIVDTLLAGGADPEAVNADGLTPLLLFVRHGPDRGDAVTLLLHAGADPDGKDPGGEAPLHIAVRTGGNRGKVDVAEALLAGGADPCVRDAQGFIPYSAAAEGGPIHQALDRAGGYDRACDRRDEAIALDSDQRRRIQAALASAGFDPGPADGKFGPRTHRAIAAWQQATGYAATGELTSEQVETLLAEPAPAVALSPKCEDIAEPTDCWMKIADKPGCRQFDWYGDVTITWSGSCSGGIAHGPGELRIVSNRPGGKSFTQTATGTLSDGKRHGHWVERGDDGSVWEGHFVDGKPHGHWVERDADGSVWEGPYVDGVMHGHWVVRRADGSVLEGPMVTSDFLTPSNLRDFMLR